MRKLLTTLIVLFSSINYGCFSRMIWERPGDPSVISNEAIAKEFYGTRGLRNESRQFSVEPKEYGIWGGTWRVVATPISFIGDVVMTPLSILVPPFWFDGKNDPMGYWWFSRYDFRYEENSKYRINRDWSNNSNSNQSLKGRM